MEEEQMTKTSKTTKKQSKKSNLNAPKQNRAKKSTGSSAKKTSRKPTAKKTTKATAPKRTTKAAAPKTNRSTSAKGKTTAKKSTAKKMSSSVKKVYKNEKGKVVYKETTDRVGDILVNGAGVKFKITGERRVKPTGYDDGKLKIRVLTVEQGKQKMEFLDTDLKYYRDKKILKRMQK